ncbi:hypothetical protein F1529_13120 [Alcanivorax sp. VBW004]|uniref:hypothetical protein n=1 Tax=Alcanivorax sp. VBW004 TaxID=1287708 RepID=UPI0012BC2132|nr:hypothetical protein [Alcanivorax sp. VBW004]MTT53423.1 hypothetical protein [Alcanivorax sp. VBW004]
MMGRIRISPVTPQGRVSGRSTAKKILAFFALIVGACLHAKPVHALEAMDDTEMGTVTGQKGILLSLQYYYNSHPDLDGAPVSECSTPNGGTSLDNMNCRFGVQLKNRETEWLVFKNGHASLDITRLALDASVLGDSHGSSSAYTGYFNAAKFSDESGSCLLEGACTTNTIADMAGLRLSYPEGENGANFGNVRFGMFFEGLAVEPNGFSGVDGSGNLIPDPTKEGWEINARNSFMGLNIADNNGHQARIAFGGDFYLYGF